MPLFGSILNHDPEQIPNEAVKAAYKAWHEGSSGNPEDFMRAAIMAALESWRTEKHKAIIGKALDEVGGTYDALILPLGEAK